MILYYIGKTGPECWEAFEAPTEELRSRRGKKVPSRGLTVHRGYTYSAITIAEAGHKFKTSGWELQQVEALSKAHKGMA